MLFAGGMFWVCSFLGRETDAVSWEAIPSAAWLSLVYLILFGSILAYTSYIWLLKVRPATEVGTMPTQTRLWRWFWVRCWAVRR